MRKLFSCRSAAVSIAVLVAALTACGRGGPTATTDQGGRPGEVGISFNVTVFRPKSGGTVSTEDGRIDCGPAATADKCFATYAWNEVATIIAMPADGFMFGGWAGDCFTRGEVDGVYTCVLSTATSQGGTGADKYVVAVFGEPGLTLHPNFTPKTGPDGKYLQGVDTTHGAEFLKWIDIARDGQPELVAYFDCGACHGGNFDGLGIAPSCTGCHEKNGHPDWRNECTFCHGSPPGSSARPLDQPPFAHPPVVGGPTACAVCHADTVDSVTGTTRNWSATTPTNTHMNGTVDGGGHAAGYSAVGVHGSDFLDAAAALPQPISCRQCHGANFEGGLAQSCDACHQSNGWASDWKTNCTFCHGTKTFAYTSADLNASAPGFVQPIVAPQTIEQHLGQAEPAGARAVGKHWQHLALQSGDTDTGGGQRYPAFACATCHPVPTGTPDEIFSHISNGRVATVQFDLDAAFPGLSEADKLYNAANVPNWSGTFDPVTARCTTYCHGSPEWGGAATLPSTNPLWSTAGGLIQATSCGACHAETPLTNLHQWHSSLLGDLGLNGCGACHDGATHLSGLAEIAFEPNPLPSGATVSGTWTRSAGTCTVNCHDESFSDPLDPFAPPIVGPGNPQEWRRAPPP